MTDPVRYTTEVNANHDDASCPTLAVFTIGAEAATLIFRLSELARLLGLWEVQKHNSSCRWLERTTADELGDADPDDFAQVRTECARLVVDDTEFWFVAGDRYDGNVEFATDRQSVAELAERFAPATPEADEDGGEGARPAGVPGEHEKLSAATEAYRDALLAAGGGTPPRIPRELNHKEAHVDDELIDKATRAAICAWCGVATDDPVMADFHVNKMNDFSRASWRKVVEAVIGVVLSET